MKKQIAFLLYTSFASGAAHAALSVHEWGTFTSLVGSNGVTQHGMYHEDEALPDFVHGFGETLATVEPTPTPRPHPPHCGKGACFSDEFFTQNEVTQKMETPVLYFHSDRNVEVDINVKFPDGVISQTFPAPVKTFPTNESTPVLGNGDTTFHVKVLSPVESALNSPSLPSVDPQNIYVHARGAQANLVQAGNEYEKFIFYRGLGRFQPKIEIRSRGGELKISNPPASTSRNVPAIFLVHVDSLGSGQLLPLGALAVGSGATVDASTLNNIADHSNQGVANLSIKNLGKGFLVAEKAKESLVSALTGVGLNLDEAQAMVNTWENGYLKVPGLRLLYVLPREEVEQVLPMQISPKPESLTRVFVGRMEVLLDTQEQKILSEIQAQRASFNPFQLGRFAEPMLRRVREVYTIQTKALEPTMIQILDGLIAQTARGKKPTLDVE